MLKFLTYNFTCMWDLILKYDKDDGKAIGT